MNDADLDSCFIGVDVGTGSVRAALVRKNGKLLASSTHDIALFRDPTDNCIFEQSSTNIWTAICTSVRAVLSGSHVPAESVKGLGFDATCSLAVCDSSGAPIVITRGDQLGHYGERNIILWADHRAEEEAALINDTGSIVLNYVGGTMSLEMEIPKILWLKHHMPPDLFAQCQFFDLPDYLTFRSTRSRTRSSCSLTCKCSFIPHTGWQADFFRAIGLAEFVDKSYSQIGAGEGNADAVLTAGVPVGDGLSIEAAKELGLVVGTPVGSALIDAYAGWLGTVAARYCDSEGQLSPAPTLKDSKHRLAAVAGTSTCYLLQSPEDTFVPGVWGPYKDAVFPGYWMSEAGQSASGQLIEFTLTTHPAYDEVVGRAREAGKDVHTFLQNLLDNMCAEAGAGSPSELTRDLHVYPDLRGNRSPLSDPRMRGSIVGLALDASIHDLARRYYATLEALALQTRHIVEVLSRSHNDRGSDNKNDDSCQGSNINANTHAQTRAVRAIYLSGGQVVSGGMMVQLIADACGVPVVLPDATHINSGGAGPVVLGATILGRYAAELKAAGDRSNSHGEKLWEIMVEMTPPGRQILPSNDARKKRLVDAKYKIFMESIEIQRRWRKEMDNAFADNVVDQ